jgi:hypothetical protein
MNEGLFGVKIVRKCPIVLKDPFVTVGTERNLL